MKKTSQETLWEAQSKEWRHPSEAMSFWNEASHVSPELLEGKAYGDWWQILEKLKITLLVSREYEHLLQSFSILNSAPHMAYMRLPHPSGLAVHPKTGTVSVASSRNPNQIYEFKPSSHEGSPLLPSRSWFYPGKVYLHDLAWIGDKLHANAVGHNAIIRLEENGSWKRVWWPRCLDDYPKPFEKNYLQLNSIAAGKSLKSSFFSASVATPGHRRPGHQNFSVDKKGVLFSGQNRLPLVTGLTRPHSARLHSGELWVNNSGYGSVGTIQKGVYVVQQELPGWTRGLAFCQNVYFVGTSRVIPRFKKYAPGLDPKKCCCGIHAFDLKTGRLIGSYLWPYGNQIFALDWLPTALSSGYPFYGKTNVAIKRAKCLFYESNT